MTDSGTYFPLFIDLKKRQILVFGGGTIATRRISSLMDFKVDIKVVSPECTDEIASLVEQRLLVYEKRCYIPGEIKEPFLVLATTSDPIINNQIYDECKQKRILVNVASDQRKSDFFFPGLAKRKSIVIGITASGKDHAKAKRLTEKIKEMLKSEEEYENRSKWSGNMRKIRIGSRESELAVRQSQILIDSIKRYHADMEVELITMKTTGDIILDRSLDKIGGKGLFVKELDIALIEGRSDLSVHSLKDMPMDTPDELPIIAFSKREDPRDALVLPLGCNEINMALPLGCSSKRRLIQLKKIFPNANFKGIRGNVLTRLDKLDRGEYGALVLAVAGLKRLGLEHRINRIFSVEEIIPAAGQGVLAVQGRSGEEFECLKQFHDEEAAFEAECERAFVGTLDGGCSSPVAAYAKVEGEKIKLLGLYYDEITGGYITGSLTGEKKEARQLGEKLANKLRTEWSLR